MQIFNAILQTYVSWPFFSYRIFIEKQMLSIIVFISHNDRNIFLLLSFRPLLIPIAYFYILGNVFNALSRYFSSLFIILVIF